MEAVWTAFRDAIKAALQQYGAGVVLLMLAVIALFRLLIRSFENRLRDKDLELKRVIRQRNALQALVLKQRRSTGLEDEKVDEDEEEEEKN